MSDIRKMTAEEIGEFVRIVATAYPGSGFATEEAKNRLKERLTQTVLEDPTACMYGFYRDGRMLGGMKWYDFTMNVHGIRMLVGGIGLVAVDLLHKKEKIAKQMLYHFLHSYRERGVSMVLLYPFRVDFYKQMGFGVGTKMNQYRVQPASLPNRGTKQNLVYLGKSEREAIVACYNRYASGRHGMIDKNEYEIRAILENPENVIVGCKQGDSVTGYLVFSFRKASDENFGLNNILVKEFICETREAMSELLTFLHSQADQVNRIIFNTQDEHFHHLLSTPGNGTNNLLPHVFHESNTSGVGLMYRVIHVGKVFEELSDRNFGGCTVKLKLAIRDSFYPENNGSTIVHFRDGLPSVAAGDEFDLEVGMDISDFSSLLMGAVTFRSLYRYGLVDVSDPSRVEMLDRLFHAEEKPVCTTAF